MFKQVGFIKDPFFTLCVCVCVCARMWIQVPSEAIKGYKNTEARVTGNCELPDMGAGNWTQVLLQKRYELLTAESFLQPLCDPVCMKDPK